jgi:hypothetical protein
VDVNLLEIRSIAQRRNQLASRRLVCRRGTRPPVIAHLTDLCGFERFSTATDQVGEQKILRSDSERSAEKARKADIEVKIDFRKLL